MLQDIYYRQEQAVAMALRQEKKMKKESIYDSYSGKPDLDLAEQDHTLGMTGLKKINQQYYSVKNLHASQERPVKMSTVDMLFNNVKKSNVQDGYFHYKENKKLQEMLSSGQLPPRVGGSVKKSNSRQISRNDLSKNEYSNVGMEQQQGYPLSRENGEQELSQTLQRELSDAVEKFSQYQKMSFAQLGGFLNHIQILQHIKYDKSSKLSNEQDIIKFQSPNNYFHTEMRLHELFWEVLCLGSDMDDHHDATQRVSAQLIHAMSCFLLNQEKLQSSPLSLKDNILILLQCAKNTSNNSLDDNKCQEFPDLIIENFVQIWEQVITKSRLEQIVRNLIEQKRARKRKVSFSKEGNNSASRLPTSNSKIPKSGGKINSNQGSNNNIAQDSDNSQNSIDAKWNELRVRSQSSSSCSQLGGKKYQPLKQQENVEQDISNIINRIKRHSDQFHTPLNAMSGSNNNINNQTAFADLEGGHHRRYTTQSDQREGYSDFTYTYYQSANKLNNSTAAAASTHIQHFQDSNNIAQSWPQFLSDNKHTSSSQQLQGFSAEDKSYYHNLRKSNQCHNSSLNQNNGIIQSIKITEMNKNEFDQLQFSIDYQYDKEVTFAESKQECSRSPQDILRRKNKSKLSQENCGIITPKRASNMKCTQLELEGRSLSPTKTKEEQRVINLMKDHEQWKQDVIKKWIYDKEDRDFEKQKQECTFQPNLGKSKLYNDKLPSSMRSNCNVISRLYDYSTPKKRDMIQYKNIIDKECQLLGECTFKPITNSNQKQFQHISSKIQHSPISASLSQPSSAHKYGSATQNNPNDNSECQANQKIKGFEKAVNRMKKGFEKTEDQKERRNKIRTGTMYETNKNKQFNPPSMLEREKSPKHKPFYFANITLSNGKHGKVSLSESDDPIHVAQCFAIAFQLNKDMTDKLKATLVEQYKNYMITLMSSQI